MTSEEARGILEKYDLTEEELPQAVKENALNIGMFTMPYKKNEMEPGELDGQSKRNCS